MNLDDESKQCESISKQCEAIIPQKQQNILDYSDPKWHFCNVLLTRENIRRKRKEKLEDVKVSDPPKVCDYKTKNRDAMRVHLRTKHWVYYCGYCRTRWVGRDGQKQMWKRHMEADCRKPTTVLNAKGNVIPKKKQEKMRQRAEANPNNAANWKDICENEEERVYEWKESSEESS